MIVLERRRGSLGLPLTRRLRPLSVALMLLCAAVWVLCALRPLDPATWRIEQLALALGLLVLWVLRRSVRFGTAARIGMAVLFCVHSIGTHYTYSLTPYDAWLVDLTGISLNEWMGWERNHYDRFVHLLYGLCLTVPCQEAAMQLLGVSRRAAGFIALNMILASSAVYEIIEWIAALLFAGDLGQAYLGTQGDVWDAQFDIALAGLGALVVIALAGGRR